MLAGELIALRPQPRDDALAIDERLRAAERDKAYFRRHGVVFRFCIGHAGKELMTNPANSNPPRRRLRTIHDNYAVLSVLRAVAECLQRL